MDKPGGLTSHDVVARVRRLVGTRAVGHTGTLDPFATGLLVILVGRATRLARFVEQQAKTYLATARLGRRTSTDDRTGAPVGLATDASALDPGAIRAALAALSGEQLQVPPAFSAKKVDGERSYRRAREGREVALAAVPVTVHEITPVEVAPPLVTFRARVSAGTYIRALARDFGERLGVGAHLEALRREAIGSIRVEAALPLDGIEPGPPLLPVSAVLGHLPAVQVSDAEQVDVSHGRPLAGREETGTVQLVHGGRTIAVAQGGEGVLRPVVVLVSA